MARAMLGQGEEAAKDLQLASTTDYDEEINAVLKKAETNAHKLEEHQRKYERLRKDREERKVLSERQRPKAQAQAAYEKAKKQESASAGRSTGFPGRMVGGMPGGFPTGMGGCMPGGFLSGMGDGMPGGFPAGMGGGMPGAFPSSAPGGAPGGVDLGKILNDPELMAPFQDPEVMAALQDVMKNPVNLVKHQSNPKVASIIAKMMAKFGGPK